MTEGSTERPKRDVSSRTAIGRCDHCGGHANSTLGGEHIWKCSEIVPIEVLEEFKELAEEWQDDAEIFLDPDDENVSDGERGASLQQLRCAEEIEDLLERYVGTEDEQ